MVNKRRNKYSFNIIDIILLIVIAISLCAVVFLFVYNGNDNDFEKKDNTVEIIYTVKQTELPDILRGKINMGEMVVTSNNLSKIGQVVDFQYTDSVYRYIDSETDTVIQSVYPGKIDMTVKISAIATKSDDGIYRINGQLVSVGEEIDLRFPFYTGKAVCVSVSEVSE